MSWFGEHGNSIHEGGPERFPGDIGSACLIPFASVYAMNNHSLAGDPGRQAG